jgi:hypothetical protein
MDNVVTTKGFPVLERIDFDTYDSLSSELGVSLPSVDKIHRENLSTHELFVLRERYEINFNIACTTYSFVFKKGTIFDKASVPSILRSVVDNDSYYVIRPSLIHDAMFALHLVPYRVANKLFKEYIKYEYDHEIAKLSGRAKRKLIREKRFKTAMYFFGVSTRKGRRIYNSIEPKNHWLNGYIEFKMHNRCK